MRSTVDVAVLGLVLERPSYGYELSKRFEQRFGALLSVSRSHIYSALNSLLRDRLIEPLPHDGSLRQPKVHYRATADGVAAFRTWLAERRALTAALTELDEAAIS